MKSKKQRIMNRKTLPPVKVILKDVWHEMYNESIDSLGTVIKEEDENVTDVIDLCSKEKEESIKTPDENPKEQNSAQTKERVVKEIDITQAKEKDSILTKEKNSNEHDTSETKGKGAKEKDITQPRKRNPKEKGKDTTQSKEKYPKGKDSKQPKERDAKQAKPKDTKQDQEKEKQKKKKKEFLPAKVVLKNIRQNMVDMYSLFDSQHTRSLSKLPEESNKTTDHHKKAKNKAKSLEINTAKEKMPNNESIKNKSIDQINDSTYNVHNAEPKPCHGKMERTGKRRVEQNPRRSKRSRGEFLTMAEEVVPTVEGDMLEELPTMAEEFAALIESGIADREGKVPLKMWCKYLDKMTANM